MALPDGFKKELEEQNVTLLQAKNDLFIQLQAEQDSKSEAEERVQQLITQKADFEAQIKDMEGRLGEEEGKNMHSIIMLIRNIDHNQPDLHLKTQCVFIN